MRDRFLIIDGHGLIYRSIFRPGPPLTSPSGEPTRGTYTFVQSLLSVFDKIDPQYAAIALDGPRRKSFRRKLYPPYKAKRKESNEDVIIQLQRCVQIIQALNVPVFTHDSYEADDVIATLVKRYADDSTEAVVATRDKDMHQLVGQNCRLFDPATGDWIGREQVQQRWGVPPKQVVEVMTLQGDPTDGVPGIRGVGKVKALALIKAHGTAEDVAKHCGYDLEETALMRKLVRLRRNVPLPDLSPEDLAFKGINTRKAKPLFRKLGFRTYL